MKWIKIIIITLLSLVVLIGGGSWLYIQSMKPEYNETLVLEGLSAGVDVFYDEYAIPHIYAKSERDAYQVLGYVHAKERLWQMEIVRRIAPGRLSEVFGTVTIETDKLFRTIGIKEYTKKSVEYFHNFIDPKIRDLAKAYIKGINQFISQGRTPIEYKIVGLKKTPFTEEDIFNVMGYMAFSFALAHRTEPIMDYVKNELGSEYLADLDVHVDTSTTLIKSNPVNPDYRALSYHIDRIMSSLPAPSLIGSNSWVLGPEKTRSGKVILANDPHIGFSQPCVWFEAHIEAPGVSLYGNYLAGYPFAQMGHNDHHAIGLTMFENDDIDFFRETVNPKDSTQYMAIDTWLNFDIRQEVIHVKDSQDVSIIVRNTRHGPVMNDVVKGLKDTPPVSMYWVYQKFPNRLPELSYRLLNARSLEAVQEGVALLHAPGLNIMYGDIFGNVAWWAAAKLPKRASHVNSKLILDGASGADDITEYHPFSSNPQAVNPPWSYVYSANNQPTTADGIIHPGYYLPESRARRIVKLLDAKNDWTVDDVKEMMLDVRSENVPEIIQSISEALSTLSLDDRSERAMSLLSQWDGTFDPDAKEPVLYTKLLYNILDLGMRDELGKYFDVYNGTHVMKRSNQPLIANASSVWWDDITTEAVESGADIFKKALDQSLRELDEQLGSDMNKWRWADVHTLEHGHSLGANATLRSFFNIGPFGVGGTTDVINNHQFPLSGDGTYEVSAGPSCRRIIDFEDIMNNSWSILPTGQSGNVLSPHYDDQAEMYIQGQFRKQMMDEDEIKDKAKYKSEFLPQK